ncbi:DNA translocase FtsK family protein, partial [Peptoniphilus sp. oral taxon 836 str. F0141]
MDKKKKILKKNKVKAPNTKTVGEPKSEIFGLFLMVIGIIFFISIFSDKMGIIGRLVYKFLSVLLGSANYIFPLLLIFWGILYNITATKLYTKRYIICSLIIYFSILILLDASKELDLTLVDRINRSIEYMSIARSGGIIGAILGFFSYKLLGSLGTYIFVGIIILVNLYIMLRTNIDQIIMAYEDLSDYLEDRKKILAEKKIKRENDKSNQVEEKELKKSQKEDKKLKILDNFKIKKDNLLEDNKTKENKDFIIKEYKTTNINNTQENNSNIQESSSEELTEKDKEEFKNIDQELPDETYIYPDISLLNINESNNTMSNQEIIKNGKIIEKTLDNFNMDCQITSINKGPVITCYELKPAPGIKLSRIVSLSDNISMALGSSDIRIEAPIPGKTVVGIEVANK